MNIDLDKLAEELMVEGWNVDTHFHPHILHVHQEHAGDWIWLRVWSDGQWSLAGNPGTLTEQVIGTLDVIRNGIKPATSDRPASDEDGA